MRLTTSAPGASFDPTQEVFLRLYRPAAQFRRGIWLVLWHYLQIEIREAAAVTPTAAMGLLVALVASLMVELGTPNQLPLAAGVLWGAMLLAGPVGLERQSSGSDFQASMTYLLLSPLPRSSLFLGKWLFQSLLMFCSAGVSLIAVSIFWNAPVMQVWILTSVILGCTGLSAAGVSVASLTVAMKKNQGLIAAVVLPLTLPLFLIGMSLCRAVWSGAPWRSFQHWFLLLLLYNVLALLGGLWAAERIWQEWQ